ncbi:MAG: universal stress protein [Gemmatimonadales bacterium]|nr:universal stress protein [Gemmatimonadales bacterium]NIP08573.1 universal stress protein [Gemmatimonadales bacterium]NIQ99110.1 universal stress protein [Gemmatimonadales bacterium]NIS66080.1 universal stress protein [Gemmatimonadales bacterium]
MYANVLVPLGGSSFSEHAIPYATAIANRAGARLTAVLVHSPSAPISEALASTPLTGEWESRLRQREAAYVTDLVGRLEERGVEAVAELKEGEVARQLIERAKSGADLLVMATHGRAGLERAWLSSRGRRGRPPRQAPGAAGPARLREAASIQLCTRR